MKTKEKQNSKLLYLSLDRLLTHPQNLRRFYPESQVHEIAESIRAANGVLQALLVVPSGEKGKYFVVDGNMRLAGGRLLGEECPKLKCEVINKDKAKQLIDMLITAKFRYDPDPISEALHYKRLMDEEHYSVKKIVQATGIHAVTLESRLELLKLEPEIQDLIGKRMLPTDKHAVQAFLSISSSKARVKLAQRLGREEVTVKAIIASCERLASQIKEISKTKTGASSASAIAQQHTDKVSPHSAVKWSQVKNSAMKMCEECDVKTVLLKSIPEPAWLLITHAADSTCQACNVRQIRSACNQCPGVDIIRRLISAKGEK